MAGDTLKFVDSIASSPTTRLDVNDQAKWWVRGFDAPPPPLVSNMVSNAMTDGGYQSSSAYGPRTLTLTVDIVGSSMDDASTEFQKLARELDRSNNFLMFQPVGASSPVFFKTYRTSPDVVEWWAISSVARQVQVQILAEPFALGIRKTISALTVTNDPAAASRGNFYDIAAADSIGDAPAPLLIHETSFTHQSMILGVRQHGTPSDLVFFKQCESMGSFSADTSNPGGAADAAMSGTGTTNYVRTTFATTAAMAVRLVWDLDAEFNTSAEMEALRGSYRLYAVVRYTSGIGTNVLTVQAATYSTKSAQTGPEVDIVDTTSRQILDLGTFVFGGASINGDLLPIDPSGDVLEFSASRTSGAGSLEWDCVYLVPNDEMTQIHSDVVMSAPVDGFVINSIDETIMPVVGDPFSTGTSGMVSNTPQVVGGWPYVIPNQSTRIYFLMDYNVLPFSKSHTASWALSYWPRYLHVRPAST